MKKLVILLFITCAVFAQNNPNNTVESIMHNMRVETSKVLKAEYNIQAIDTFTTGHVWDNNGYALIEKNEKDKLLGFYFSGERFDINQQTIYDGINVYNVNKTNKSYNINKPNRGVMGSPGGQMVCQELLYPDSIYKSATLMKENSNSFLIRLSFDDIPDYNITDRIKIYEVNNNSFLPMSVSYSYRMLDKKGVQKYLLSNLKINEAVQSSIDKLKIELSNYKNEPAEKPDTLKKLINKAASQFKLPELFNADKYHELTKGKIILLDFWEVWCGPCIKSFPEVEKIHNKFLNDVEVIGITTSEAESAKKMVRRKELTYLNLLGNANMLKEYAVIGVPRYVLIDKKGIIRNEYLGFNPQIENDISKLIKE